MRRSFFYVFALLVLMFVSCSDSDVNADSNPTQVKENRLESSDKYNSEKPNYEKIISKTLIKGEDCDEYVSGVIEHWQNGELLARIDYGDGNCDGMATKTANGESHKFSLNAKKSEVKMEKVITKALVEGEDCEEYVSGTVELKKGGITYATIDYGNGDCDGVAIKTVDGESHTFSLKHKETKQDYEKVISKRLVMGEGCDEYVSGIIEYKKGGETIATVDYGNGECDGIAVKIANGESHTFKLTKNK